MHDETPADLARILRFAATYMEEHGRARRRFGGHPGQPACPVAALALALGISPRRIGWGPLFLPGRAGHREVGTVILRSGLLDRLPRPAQANGPRQPRPAMMTPRQAVYELARWSDDKTLDRVVIDTLRDAARRLAAPPSQVAAGFSSSATDRAGSPPAISTRWPERR